MLSGRALELRQPRRTTWLVRGYASARQYPVFPVFLLLVLLVCPALFAQLIAPYSPIDGRLRLLTRDYLWRHEFCAVVMLQQNLAASFKFQIKTEIARLSLLLFVGWPVSQ